MQGANNLEDRNYYYVEIEGNTNISKRKKNQSLYQNNMIYVEEVIVKLQMKNKNLNNC